MKKIYLVPAQAVKDNTPMNTNVDDSLINTAIIDAQQINIQQCLGTVLYKKILTLVEDGTISASENEAYKTLLDDYIQPAIVAWSYVYAIPTIHTKIMNVGVVNQSSENSNSADLKSTEFVLNDARNKAEFYSELLTRFLITNCKEHYPEYLQNKKFDEQRPTLHQYTCGIVLDDIYPNQFHYNTYPTYLWR